MLSYTHQNSLRIGVKRTVDTHTETAGVVTTHEESVLTRCWGPEEALPSHQTIDKVGCTCVFVVDLGPDV